MQDPNREFKRKAARIMAKIVGHDGFIDSREICRRIDDLETDYTDFEHPDGILKASSEWDELEWEEYCNLLKLRSEIEEGTKTGNSAEDGIFLVNETFFPDYLREEYEEIGPEWHVWDRHAFQFVMVDKADVLREGPFRHIDWEAYADECRSDYNEVTYDGGTFLYL